MSPHGFSVWIGYDSREPIAAHVCAHSIIRRASRPVKIGFLNLQSLGEIFKRPDPAGSTEFSLSRFLTPYLADNGVSMFVDGDFLFLSDVWELYELMASDIYADVACVQHDYTPKTSTKFLGQAQATYPKKNWSSLMLFNGHRSAVRNLTPSIVQSHPPAYLHQMEWAHNISALPKAWNFLVNELDPIPIEEIKALHYTLGIPMFKEYAKCDYADVWFDELHHMQHCAE
jgi:hypothetical protein